MEAKRMTAAIDSQSFSNISAITAAFNVLELIGKA
jgi:hypothetical protein